MGQRQVRYVTVKKMKIVMNLDIQLKRVIKWHDKALGMYYSLPLSWVIGSGTV